jgi:hypothetical protein
MVLSNCELTGWNGTSWMHLMAPVPTDGRQMTEDWAMDVQNVERSNVYYSG